MIAVKSWLMPLAGSPIASLASLFSSKLRDPKQAPNAELQHWENEGGVRRHAATRAIAS